MSSRENESPIECQSCGCSEPLFSEFGAPTYDDWRKLVEADLQGVPFEKKLQTKTAEGIELKPLYVQGDISPESKSDTSAGHKPFLRSSTAAGNILSGWEVAQEMRMSSVSDVAKAISAEHEVDYLSAFVVFDRPSRMGLNPNQVSWDEVGVDGVSFASSEDAYDLLHALRVGNCSLHLDCGSSGLETIALLAAASYKLGSNLTNLKGSLGFSMLSLCAGGGVPCCRPELYFSFAAQLSRWCHANAPSFIPLAIDTRVFVEAGASATQELGFGLALGAEYLRALIGRGINPSDAASSIMFRTGIGSNFFMEIAKFRALRESWSRICDAFGVSECAQNARIHACTSRWDKSTLDVHTNMLRNTSQAFAAACGGVNFLTVSPYSELSGAPDDIARRLARNIQLILQEESNVQSVIDPAGGSYFVEKLTSEVAEKAWSLFQDVESRGGIIPSLKSAFVQDAIELTAANRVRAVAERRDVLVGVSMYPNLKDKLSIVDSSDARGRARHQEFGDFMGKVSQGALANLKPGRECCEDGMGSALVESCVVAASAGATLGELSAALRVGYSDSQECEIRPLKIRRIAEGYERLRSASLAYSKKFKKEPEIFLANMGPVRQHKARAEFSVAFFEPAGFKMLGDRIFSTALDAANGAIESGAPIVVICSTDETYPELVPTFVQTVKSKNPKTVVIVAGNPAEHVESFKQAGVDDFIHVRSNNQAKLEELLSKIGAL